MHRRILSPVTGMSRGWLIGAIGCIAFAVTALVAGWMIPDLWPFTENVFAEAAGLFLALGIAILAIEGRLLTHQERRGRVVARMARDLIQEVSYGINMLPQELAEWLGSELPEPIEVAQVYQKLEEDGGTDWASTAKLAFLRVFDAAKAIPEAGSLHETAVEEQAYRREVDAAEGFIRGVRERLRSNIDLYTILLELVNALDALEPVVKECRWSVSLRTAEGRMRALGQLGVGYVRFLDDYGKIAERLQR